MTDDLQASYDAQRDGRHFVVTVLQNTADRLQVTTNLLGELGAK